MMKNKKGMDNVIWIVVVFILLLLFMIIYTGIWKGILGKNAEGLSKTTDDGDSDGIPNIVDKCPKEAGRIEFDGCKDEGLENA